MHVIIKDMTNFRVMEDTEQYSALLQSIGVEDDPLEKVFKTTQEAQ